MYIRGKRNQQSCMSSAQEGEERLFSSLNKIGQTTVTSRAMIQEHSIHLDTYLQSLSTSAELDRDCLTLSLNQTQTDRMSWCLQPLWHTSTAWEGESVSDNNRRVDSLQRTAGEVSMNQPGKVFISLQINETNGGTATTRIQLKTIAVKSQQPASQKDC